jgi:spore maturation protein CgeB
VVHLKPEGDTGNFGKFDLHFWIDYGEDGLPVDHTWELPKDGGKTIYVCSDAHYSPEAFKFRSDKAREFDYVFVNQLRYVDEFKTVGVEDPIFLPHAAEPQAYPKYDIVKKWDVSFIGHLQDVKNYNGFSRIDMLDRAFKEFPNFYFGSRNPMDKTVNLFEDASKKFCQTRVVLNISIKDDINMRNFEIASSGSFQLTNYIPTIDQVFEDGKHLVTYKTLDEMVEKVKYYLEHEEEREKIALAGYEHFLKHHTYRHRIETILKTIGIPYKVKKGSINLEKR